MFIIKKKLFLHYKKVMGFAKTAVMLMTPANI
jgi:hypothetical protein